MPKKQKKSALLMNGFSLLEVMVALTIVGGLGVALIQSQIHNLSLVDRFKKTDQLEQKVKNTLLAIEINQKLADSFTQQGVYGEKSDLPGKRWTMQITDEALLNLPVRKVKFTIYDATPASFQVSHWLWIDPASFESIDFTKILQP